MGDSSKTTAFSRTIRTDDAKDSVGVGRPTHVVQRNKRAVLHGKIFNAQNFTRPRTLLLFYVHVPSRSPIGDDLAEKLPGTTISTFPLIFAGECKAAGDAAASSFSALSLARDFMQGRTAILQHSVQAQADVP